MLIVNNGFVSCKDLPVLTSSCTDRREINMPIQLVYSLKIKPEQEDEVLAILNRFKAWNVSQGASLRNWRTVDAGDTNAWTQIIEFPDQEGFDAVLEARQKDAEFADIIGAFMSHESIELLSIVRMEELG